MCAASEKQRVHTHTDKKGRTTRTKQQERLRVIDVDRPLRLAGLELLP